MSKHTSQLKNAIHSLNIKKPFDLRAQMKPALKAPAQIEHTEKEPADVEQAPNEPTQGEVTSAGFFMLAHSVFNNSTVRDLSGDAFRIFIWMSSQAWRFRESNGVFRAAVDYIALKSGCSRSTVTRGLGDLKATRLIECVEQNFKKGNLWKVSRIADGRFEQTENEPVQSKAVVCSKPTGSMPKLTTEPAQNDHHIRTPLKINKNSEEAAAFQTELKMIWEEFRIRYASPAEQETELSRQLQKISFGANQPFAKDMAVLKWWETKGASQSSGSAR